MSHSPHGQDGGAFAWEVVLPERRRRMGGKAPLASLRMHDGQGGVSYERVPVAVARALTRQRAEGSIDPQSADDLRAAAQAATRTAALNRIAQLVTRRDYASVDALRRLRDDGFDPQAAQAAVSRAQEVGLLSDARFADVFIRSKVAAGWGMDRIERELARHGVEPGSVEGWPHEYLDPGDELTRALEVARRKTVREPNALQKLARFLVGRGFSYGVAMDAARQTMDERDADT